MDRQPGRVPRAAAGAATGPRALLRPGGRRTGRHCVARRIADNQGMNGPRLHPLLFRPVYKDYPWGGRWLESAYGRSLPGAVAAESWEIADRPEGMSVVAEGPEEGTALGELVARWGAALVGAAAGRPQEGGAGGQPERPRFPLLFKILDARERLSLQVHPDDDSAARLGGEAKSEMWVTLDADPGARVLVGLRPGIDRAAFERALAADAVEACLGPIPVAEGTVVPVPGGRLHAIDAGCRLYEIQQNSNTTYRVHDWGRLDAAGRPRPLHVREALAAITWEDAAAAPAIPRSLPAPARCGRWELWRSRHFQVQRLQLTGPLETSLDGRSFHALFLHRGTATVEGGGIGAALAPGTSCLLPAGLGAYTLRPQGSVPAELLLTTL